MRFDVGSECIITDGILIWFHGDGSVCQLSQPRIMGKHSSTVGSPSR